jgi:hypothetical protein
MNESKKIVQVILINTLTLMFSLSNAYPCFDWDYNLSFNRVNATLKDYMASYILGIFSMKKI